MKCSPKSTPGGGRPVSFEIVSLLIDAEKADFHINAIELRRRGTIPMTEGIRVKLAWNADEALIYPAD